MRLATKHQAAWLGLEDCGIAEVTRNVSRFGSTEMVRMGQGEPIVLLPGLAGGWRLLAPMARLLSRHNEVILIGLRGDEGTPGTRFQSASDHAYDVARTIEHLGLERPTIAGVSFGGVVALELALEHPGSVGGLALYGVPDRFQASLGSTILIRTLERLPLPSDSAFLNQFFNVVVGRRPEPGPLVDFLVKRCWQTDQSVVASRLRSLESYDVRDRLWKFDGPSIVMAGTRDVCVPLARQENLANSLPNARFRMIEGAGHVGFLTNAAEVAAEIESLLPVRSASHC